MYCSDLVSESNAEPYIQSELSAIGIKINPVELTFDDYTSYLFTPTPSANTTNGFGIGYYSEDYFASQDYVTALANSENNYTGAPVIFANESIFATNAATANNSATLIQAYQNVTKTMYNGYVLDWLYVPDFLAVNANNVAGIYAPNPTGSCAGYFMYYNTVHYT